jgi:hypothetical protein
LRWENIFYFAVRFDLLNRIRGATAALLAPTLGVGTRGLNSLLGEDLVLIRLLDLN